MKLIIGGKYNWKYTPEDKLVYLGKKGVWHQFVKIGDPREVRCEVLDSDLHMLEETKSTGLTADYPQGECVWSEASGVSSLAESVEILRTPQDVVEKLIRSGWGIKFVNGEFIWTTPRNTEYNSGNLYYIPLDVFNDANQHGELS